MPSTDADGCTRDFPVSTAAAATGGLSFVVADRLWWLALLAACYRRAPMEVLAMYPAGRTLVRRAEHRIGAHRLAKIGAWLGDRAQSFAASGAGKALQRGTQVDPKRLVLTLPQSIALYNVFLPVWLPLNGWLAAGVACPPLP
mmetsp:Transcript_31385/g.90101  ORF Transcript_31385/g.90101 Transcript_31385/m.90101 type:complete len:143 (-) Transcript_31385:218-646(-)